jgi:hypothetical protein
LRATSSILNSAGRDWRAELGEQFEAFTPNFAHRCLSGVNFGFERIAQEAPKCMLFRSFEIWYKAMASQYQDHLSDRSD